MKHGSSALAALSVAALLAATSALWAEDLPIVSGVEFQPLAAQVARLLQALEFLGEPLPTRDTDELHRLLAAKDDPAVTIGRLQVILDRHCLAGVHINPESRLKAQQGPAKAELVEQGWRTFLVKVHNQAGITAALAVTSPSARDIPNAAAGPFDPPRFLQVDMFNRQPLKPHLSGLELEYRILQLYSTEAGKREAKLIFDAGHGTQDLGFRSEVDILFTAKPANKIQLRVIDTDGQPTTAAFTIRDTQGRIYPAQGKRLAPDFFFQPQIYRSDGDVLLLPDGQYAVECTRGPEYLKETRNIRVDGRPLDLTFRLKRWIDPSALGWVSGDHHIHAAGCSHYIIPTEGVYPQDMMHQILGEDLKNGAVLSWGPGWYFQKTFFDGRDHPLSTDRYKMHYDVEISGFPSSHAGHICLLGLRDQDYPGTKRIEDWPSWGNPVLKWARGQGALTGYAHSGWGLKIDEAKLPSLEMPPFDGIGANEYIVTVTQDLIDFISAVDTPWPWELNIWYHTLNAGYRTRISGETDFPCIYDARVGLGRSYVRQRRQGDYADWLAGIREGRAYVSDGMSHILGFKVNQVEMGDHGSELRLSGPATVKVTAQVAALLPIEPDSKIAKLPVYQQPYWHLERARLEGRRVAVELIANGIAVAQQQIQADGAIHPIIFDCRLDRSSWVALRILPSSHTDPIFVLIGDKPIRGSRESIEWCLEAVDQCWSQKQGNIRAQEQDDARRGYEHARQAYRQRLGECDLLRKSEKSVPNRPGFESTVRGR